MEPKKAEELVRRLAAALRGTELYSPTHPLVQRGIDTLSTAALDALQGAPSVVIGFIGDEVVVDAVRLARGLTRDEIRSVVVALSERGASTPLAERLAARGVRHVALGRIVVEQVSD